MDVPKSMFSELCYRRYDFENAVASDVTLGNGRRRKDVARKAPLVISSRQHPASLGKFEEIPLELLCETLALLDLASLTTFRSLNTRARSITDSLAWYTDILTHAPVAFRALLNTGAAAYFTAPEIRNELFSSECAACGKFGGFLSMLDLVRCCIPCLGKASELMPISQTDAEVSLGLTKANLSKVVTVVTLPGSYTLVPASSWKRRLRLVSAASAYSIAMAVHKGEQNIIEYVKHDKRTTKLAYDKRVAEDVATTRENTRYDIRRYMVATPFPYLDRGIGKVHPGVACTGCRLGFENYSGADRDEKQYRLDKREETYSDDEFWEHFQKCPDAQKVWRTLQQEETCG